MHLLSDLAVTILTVDSAADSTLTEVDLAEAIAALYTALQQTVTSLQVITET